MSKLTETYARKAGHSVTDSRKHWGSEIKGLGLFIGKKAKTWYFQRDVGGQTRRILIGRFPEVSSAATIFFVQPGLSPWFASTAIDCGAPNALLTVSYSISTVPTNALWPFIFQ